jgi:enolase
MATARALAMSAGVPLWRSLSVPGARPRLPWPCFNVLNGGVHAPNALDFQEFMVTPLGAPTLAEAVRAGVEVYAALRKRLASKGLATGLGDEGGFAPEIDVPEDVLATLVDAIETPAIGPAVTGWRSRWIRRPASSTAMGSTEWPETASPVTT